MSGIAATFQADGAPAKSAVLDSMAQAMAYRGADGIDTWVAGEIGLAHLALHSNADDQGGSQPLISHDGRFTISFDGYLLNDKELRTDLGQRGLQLRQGTNAELVLELFALQGKDCARQLEGEFAFAVWDAREHRITCIRDHFGMRPLTWHWDGKRLLVASDIAGVIAGLGERPAPNAEYIAEHLANEWYTHDETPWHGVMKLPGAHILELERGQAEPRISQYWTVPQEVTIRYNSDEEYAEHYLEMFDWAVTRAARSHSPVGFEVSGGLDSSSVFCLADRALKAGRLDAPDIKGFGLRGHPGDESDEIAYIRAVAKHTGRDIAEVPLFEPDIDWYIEQGIRDATLPFPPNTVMLATLQEKVSAAGCRISLTGQGGDQWLDGVYQHYRESLAARDWPALANSLAAHRRDAGAISAARHFWRYGLKSFIPPSIKRSFRTIRPRKAHWYEKNEWIAPELREVLKEKRRAYESRLTAVPPESRYKLGKWDAPFTGLVNEMMNLQAAHRQLEYRHPMLSRRFVEFSTGTPEHIRRRGTTRRHVHRLAMKDILPEKVRTRPDDATFNSPFYCLYDEINEYCRQEIANSPFADYVVDSHLPLIFVSDQRGGSEVVPIWELWGLFAGAAFFDAPGLDRSNRGRGNNEGSGDQEGEEV
ncbi:asparagine synthetase B family protein [Aurantiacibacter odishensis]|uniref:asparagine synthetase B family protein n=1 Tax=Aurantiacibacter odishensis TaxID=1155476 RepID=UPI000E740FC7|nr:asparagine synthase-related protein [Aurantiacibacter odishensis]